MTRRKPQAKSKKALVRYSRRLIADLEKTDPRIKRGLRQARLHEKARLLPPKVEAARLRTINERHKEYGRKIWAPRKKRSAAQEAGPRRIEAMDSAVAKLFEMHPELMKHGYGARAVEELRARAKLYFPSGPMPYGDAPSNFEREAGRAIARYKRAHEKRP